MKKVLFCLLVIIMAVSGVSAQNAFQWGFTLPDEAAPNRAQSIVSDSKSESYVTGHFTGRIDFGTTTLDSKGSQDAFVARFDKEGKCVWAFAIGAGGADGGTGIVLHPSEERIYVTGHYQGTVEFDKDANIILSSLENSIDVFVAAYDLEGKLQWARSAGGSGPDIPNGICTDDAGSVYLTGFFTGSTIDLDPPKRIEFSNNGTGRDIFIVKYDDASNYRWGGAIGGAAGDEGKSIIADKAGAVYVGGYFNGSGVDFDLQGKGSALSSVQADGFLAKYSAAEGTLEWAGNVGGEGQDQVNSIAVVNTGKDDVLYATGFFSGGAPDFDLSSGQVIAATYGGFDIFVAQYGIDGKFNWGNTFGGTGNDLGTSLSLTQSGNVYVTGSFIDDVDFNPDSKEEALLSGAKGIPNIFMAKYDVQGTYLWAQAIVSSAASSGLGIHAYGDGALYLAGFAGGNGELDPGKVSFSADAQGDILLAKYDTRQQQTISFTQPPAQVFGNSPFLLNAVSSSGMPVTISSGNSSVATVSGFTVTITGAGSSNLTAAAGGDENYHVAPLEIRTLSVAKASQTISFGTLAPRNFGAAPFSLTGTTSSGLTVSYLSSNPAVATVSGNTVTIVGVGSTTITASQAGNTNYNAAVSIPQTLTVNKADQTITFNTLSPATFGDAAFALTATASSGLAVSYVSSNPAVATISGSTVTIVGAGSADITAAQAGSANYNAAPSVVQTLTVNKASQTISFAPLAPRNYGAAPFSISATASSGLPVSFSSSNPAVATVSGNTITIVGAGTSTITASQAGNVNYLSEVSVPQTLTVNKLNQNITFNTLPAKTYGDPSFTLTASASSGLPVTFISSDPAVATVSGNTVTIIAPGTSIITASQAGDANFNAATQVNQTLTVNKANQTISFSTLAAMKYGDPSFTLSATATSGLPVSFISSDPSIASITGNTVNILAPGTIQITASQAGDANYNAAASVPRTLVINKADQTISFAPIPPKNFDDVPFTISASSSSGLPVSFSSDNSAVATISGNTITIVGSGTATITASQAGDANYNAAPSVIQVLSVNNSNQTISFSPLTDKNFGDAPFTLSATASSGLPVSFSANDPSVATVSGNTVTIVGAGTVLITASQPGDANFGPATPVSQTLTVNKINQTISFAAVPAQTYGAAAFNLSATSSSGLPVSFSVDDPSVASISGNTVTIVGAGSATITASQAGNSNYNAAASVAQTLLVNKAAQTITFPPLPATVYFGEAPYTVNATSSSGLPVVLTSSDNNKILPSGNQLTILSTGSVVITASQPGDNNYLPAVSIDQPVVIELPDIDIAGRTTVSDNNEEQPYSILPVLEDYTYVWYYSNSTIQFVDSLGSNVVVKFKPASDDGVMYCDVYNPAGVYFQTIGLPIKVNHGLGYTLHDPKCLELDSINPCSGTYIEYFKIGDLVNGGTDCSPAGYADYTQSTLTTKLNLSDIYYPEIRLGYNGQGNPTFFVGLWIDFNGNGSFDDPGEFLSSFFGTGTTFPLHSVRISNNTEDEGPKRLRVRVRTSGSFTSSDGCIQQGDKGETEDYMVFLKPYTKISASSVITPNDDNKNDYFYIKGVEASVENSLVVFDRLGRVQFKQDNYNNDWDGKKQDGSRLPSGTYYYVFNYGDVSIKGFFELLY